MLVTGYASQGPFWVPALLPSGILRSSPYKLQCNAKADEVDLSSLLFFTGVLLAVASLESAEAYVLVGHRGMGGFFTVTSVPEQRSGLYRFGDFSTEGEEAPLHKAIADGVGGRALAVEFENVKSWILSVGFCNDGGRPWASLLLHVLACLSIHHTWARGFRRLFETNALVTGFGVSTQGSLCDLLGRKTCWLPQFQSAGADLLTLHF